MKKKNKNFVKLFGLLSIGVIPLIVAGCSTTSNTSNEGFSNSLKNSVSKGSGSLFANDFTLQQGVKFSLENENGQKKLLEQIVGQSIFNWYTKLASSNSKSLLKKNYELELKNFNKSIDKDFLNASKKINNSSTKNNFLLKFQQDELDPVGGVESSWRKAKEIDWAISKFKNDIFKNLYVSLYDKNENFVYTNKQNLDNSLTNLSNFKIGFNKNALNLDNQDSYVSKQYADFQKFVFDQWVLSENPFIVNFAQWNYSEPKNGLNSIYSLQAAGNSEKKGSYRFPYFDSENSNESQSTVSKFKSFVDNAKNITSENEKQGYVEQETIGLKNINIGSESSEKYKLIINSKAANENDPIFALASTYLFANSFTSSQNYQQKNLNKDILTSSKNGFDEITSNFISSEESDFSNNKNQNQQQRSTNVNSNNKVPYTKIEGDLAKLIFSNNNNKDKGLFAIDAFVPNDENLKDFIFIRNKNGVFALTIDGINHIKKANTVKEAKQKAGEILLYRYLQNIQNEKKGFSFDLKGKLNSYLNDNFDSLIFKYWIEKQKDIELFDFFWLPNSLKNILNSFIDYLYIKNRITNIENYQTLIYTNKKEFFTNYGKNNALKNGLASQLPFEIMPANESLKFSDNNFNFFKVLKTLEVENPFDNYKNFPKNLDDAYSKLINTIKIYVDETRFSTLSSSYAGFKYSQYIFTDNYFINQALLAYGNDGNAIANNLIKNILLKNINKNGTIVLNENQQKINSDILKILSFKIENFESQKYINDALKNYLLNSNFNNSSSKWINLNKSFDLNVQKNESNEQKYPKLNLNELNEYKEHLWLKSRNSNTSSSLNDYISFLKLVLTIQYILKNNATRFMLELQKKISNNFGNNFIVWESSINKEFDKNSKINSSKDLLSISNSSDQKSNIIININNDFSNAYYSNSKLNNNTSVNENNYISTFNSESNYYNIVSNMIGFKGIQVENSANKISNQLNDILFKKPNTFNSKNEGFLYSYGSKENFIKIINDFTSISQINDLINKLIKLFPNISQLSSLLGISDLKAKKEKLISLVNNDSLNWIKHDLFKPRNGFISREENNSNGNKLYYDDSNSTLNNLYGSYVVQINGENLVNLDKFINYLKSAFDTIKNGNNINDLVYDLISNLLVEIASNSSIQTEAINEIASNNKFFVYDVRLNDKLGETWVKNFKNK